MMKKALILTLIFALCMSLSIPAMASEHDSYADALYSLGLFKGVGTDSEGDPIFALDESATRLQSLVMLIRLLGEEEAALSCTETHPFADVPVGHWAYSYVAYGYAKQYTSGSGANSFSPDLPATANMYLTYLLRALGYDDAAGDFSYEDAIAKAESVKLIPEDTYFAGAAVFRRDDCAYTSFLALKTKMKDGKQTLAEHLEEEGVFTEKDFAAIRLVDKRTLWLESKYTYSSSEGTTTVWVRTYDSNGTLLSAQGNTTYGDGSSQITTDTYDNAGNLVSSIVKYSDGTTENTFYTHDNAGNLTSSTYKDSSGYSSTSVYTYDAAGNELTQKYTNSEGTEWNYTYTYDREGRMLTSEYQSSDGESTSYVCTYNSAGNLVTEKQSYTYEDSTTSGTYSYTYDSDGKRLSERYEGSDGFTHEESYTYDSDGNLVSERYSSSSGFSYTETYLYDSNGNMLKDSYRDSDGDSYTSSYTYDNAGRILSESLSNSGGYSYTEIFSYDSMGNLITDVYQNSEGENYTVTYQYDKVGNEISSQFVSGDYNASYTYEYISVTVIK